MLRNELQHFIDCVRNKEQPSVTGEDGLAALEISLAAQLSAKESRIVELPIE